MWQEGKRKEYGEWKFSKFISFENKYLQDKIIEAVEQGWEYHEEQYIIMNGTIEVPATYKGFKLDGKKHGPGVIDHDWATYEGEFYEDKMHGQGRNKAKKAHEEYLGGWKNG